eukprot:2406121-Prymnesium_polylepis.1
MLRCAAVCGARLCVWPRTHPARSTRAARRKRSRRQHPVRGARAASRWRPIAREARSSRPQSSCAPKRGGARGDGCNGTGRGMGALARCQVRADVRDGGLGLRDEG